MTNIVNIEPAENLNTEREYYGLTIWCMDEAKLICWREHENFLELTCQHEICPDTGRHHYQGAIRFDKRIRLGTFRNWILRKWGKGFAWPRTKRVDSRWEKCVNYCSGNSGTGLMKCADLNHRFFISHDEFTRVATNDEGTRQWQRHHPLAEVPWVNKIEHSREDLMQMLKNNIKECQRYIMNWN